MDRWEWTRIGTAVGSAVVVALGANWLAGRIINPGYPGEPAYRPSGVVDPVGLASLQRSWPRGLSAPGEHSRLAGYMRTVERSDVPLPAPDASAIPAAPTPDLGTLLASASAQKGKGTARVCASCHTFEQGGPDRVGPNLWAIVGRDIGSKAGFAYSPAVAGHQGSWTYAELDTYLTSPARAIPGNKMSFGGIRRAEDRANVLAYLGSLNTSPVPFPKPMTAAASGKTNASLK
jgi:cytochrome c